MERYEIILKDKMKIIQKTAKTKPFRTIRGRYIKRRAPRYFEKITSNSPGSVDTKIAFACHH